MKKILFNAVGTFVIGLGFLLIPFTAQAGPILEVSGGILLGADNVEINGSLYDVDFVDGSCVSVFSGCDATSDFDFPNDQVSALAAAQALLDYVFIDVGLGNFDTDPKLIFGCPNTTTCNVYIPYALVGSSTADFAIAQSHQIEAGDIAHSPLNLDINFDFGSNTGSVLAVFTKVPEPSMLLLFGAGMAGLGAIRCKQRS